MTNPQPAVRVDARAEPADQWRKLALQFDMHRIDALSVLRGVVAGTVSTEDVRAFLAAPPRASALTPAPTEAGGVGEAAVDLLSHLKLHVMDKLGSDDADALHDCMLDLTAALACLKPGSRFTVDGVECVVVRKDALDWLNGEGDSFERPDNVRGNFWWRGEFRRRAMLRACEEN